MPVLLRKIDKIFPTLCLLWAETEVARMNGWEALVACVAIICATWFFVEIVRR